MGASDIAKITSTTTTYTVTSGDTLWAISKECITEDVPGFDHWSASNNAHVSAGVERLTDTLNPDITNPNFIRVGQEIALRTPNKKTTNITNNIKITNIGLQSSKTDNTVFATWVWTHHSKTDHYEVEWRFNTDANISNGFPGHTETTNEQLSVYSSVPADATCVTIRVKPVSKTYGKDGKSTYFNVGWSTWWTAKSTYNFSDNPPKTPPVPSLDENSISKKNKLKVKLTDLESLNAKQIEFEIAKNNVEGYKKIKKDIASNNSVSIETSVAPGAYYTVRCRSIKNGMVSEWSKWSDPPISSYPATSAGIYSIYAINELSGKVGEEKQFAVRLHWYTVSGADNYIIQHTTNEEYFDSNPNGVTEIDLLGTKGKPYELDHTEITTGLEGGLTYYFRICSVTNGNRGDWSETATIILGDKPTAPTTWSSTTTAVSGEPLTLYWVHNSKDGSSQTYANLELTTIGMVIDEETGESKYVNETVVIPYENSVLPDEKDKTSSYVIDTTKYEEGVKIKWRVQTAGILRNSDTGEYEYGEWSVHREIVVYGEPWVTLTATNYKGAAFTSLTALPINISASAGPSTQKPISFHLSVIANSNYEMVDNVGNEKMVVNGTAVYAKYFDADDNPLEVTLSAGDLSLANNIPYTITCRICMDSGLTAEASLPFTVAWETIEEFWPNAEIIYNENTFTTDIRPYCYDVNEQLIDGITLTVYRREFDGALTELGTVNNIDQETIPDPHPSLDYARYRIVAVSDTTGAVSYYDMPGHYIGEPSVILQWDEDWTNFRLNNENAVTERHWSGSLLKLMYNVDVSDQHDKEVELINYIGREHPVSYYGTQIGHTATWNMEIEKDDEETLYALRRLARWMGNVYVREPSGSGYWADVKVSFSQTHCELTIPVTLELTRVEGGI